LTLKETETGHDHFLLGMTLLQVFQERNEGSCRWGQRRRSKCGPPRYVRC